MTNLSTTYKCLPGSPVNPDPKLDSAYRATAAVWAIGVMMDGQSDNAMGAVHGAFIDTRGGWRWNMAAIACYGMSQQKADNQRDHVLRALQRLESQP